MSKEGYETSGHVTFYTVTDGKIVKRVAEGTEGAFSRVVTKGAHEGETRWYKPLTSIEGMITGGGILVKEFSGKKVQEIHIHIDDDAVLQLPIQMLSNLAKPAPNINLTLPVKIGCYKSKAGKVGLNISQDGKEIEWYYTKDAPNGLPQPTHDDIDGWDFRDHDKFLKVELNRFFDEVKLANGKDVEEPEAGATADEENSIPF